MKVRLRADNGRVGESSRFDKSELDYLFIKFDGNPEDESVPIYDVDIFLDKKDRWMPFLNAIRSQCLVFCGAPDRHFLEP